MLKFLVFALLSISAAFAQGPARIYPISASQISFSDRSGTQIVATSQVKYKFGPTDIQLTVGDEKPRIYYPSQFLREDSTAYGTTIQTARVAWLSALQSAPVARTQRIADTDLSKLVVAPMLATAKSSGATAIPRVTATASLNASTTIEPGKKYHLKGVQIFCDRPYFVGVVVRKQPGTFNNQTESTFFTLGEKQTSVVLPYDEILFEGGLVRVDATPLGGSTQDQGSLTMRLIGRTQSLCEVDDADYRIVVVGDSKALYTMDAGSFGERYYPNQLARYLESQGKKVSVIDKTQPGSSSSDGVRLLRSGALEGIKYDLLVWAYGTNNAATTATAPVIAQFKADQLEAIAHRNRTNPRASIIYMTPGVTDKTSLLPNIDAYRTAVADVANDATLGGTGRRVYVCPEHTAFTVSTTVKSDRFVSGEALNNQLHYSMLGHDDVYNNRFLPTVKQTDFYKNVLGLP